MRGWVITFIRQGRLYRYQSDLLQIGQKTIFEKILLPQCRHSILTIFTGWIGIGPSDSGTVGSISIGGGSGNFGAGAGPIGQTTPPVGPEGSGPGFGLDSGATAGPGPLLPLGGT